MVFMILVGAAPARPAAQAPPRAAKVIVFAADGMRPDLMERYAREGAMPTFAELLRQGAVRKNGLV